MADTVLIIKWFSVGFGQTDGTDVGIKIKLVTEEQQGKVVVVIVHIKTRVSLKIFVLKFCDQQISLLGFQKKPHYKQYQKLRWFLGEPVDQVKEEQMPEP